MWNMKEIISGIVEWWFWFFGSRTSNQKWRKFEDEKFEQMLSKFHWNSTRTQQELEIA